MKALPIICLPNLPTRLQFYWSHFSILASHLITHHAQQLCPELRADHAVDDEVRGAVDHGEQPRHGVEQELVGGREVVSPDLVAPQDGRYPEQG